MHPGQPSAGGGNPANTARDGYMSTLSTRAVVTRPWVLVLKVMTSSKQRASAYN